MIKPESRCELQSLPLHTAQADTMANVENAHVPRRQLLGICMAYALFLSCESVVPRAYANDVIDEARPHTRRTEKER